MEEDYDPAISYEGTRDNQNIIEFTLIPKPDAAVVWGKVVATVLADGYLPLIWHYYDEDMNIVRTMTFSKTKLLSGRPRPTVMRIVPADKPNEYTELVYEKLELDIKLNNAFSTLAMGFAGFIMILFASLTEGLLYTSERNAVAMNLGDMQIHSEGYRDDPDLYKRIGNASDLVRKLQQAGFHAAQRVYGFGLAAAGSASAGVQLRGIDLTNEATVTQPDTQACDARKLARGYRPQGCGNRQKTGQNLKCQTRR
jgi:hypothetical protein